MHKTTFLFLFVFISQITTAQNLVLNPSFENRIDNKCIVFLGGFNKYISNWSIPNYGSTDFFDTCSNDMGVKNYNGHQKPKSGSTYAGMYFYTDKNYREYVQGELSRTLVKGKTYTMTFYLSLADKSSFALKDIEVLFTEEKLKPCFHSNSCEKAIKPASVAKKNFKMYSNLEERFFSNKKSWMPYKFEFVAEGYERFFSIGNFNRNPKTKKQKVLSTSEFFFSYYYIDDVSIEPVEKEAPKKIVEEPKPEIITNTIYTFKNVLFEFDKAELLEVSKTELNQLYQHLYENKELSVEIYGHTDNIGTRKRNKELSQQRAKAVSDYLILLGLDKIRITSYGFGSSKPIADNKTQEGRDLNRRVEFKLISI